MQLFDAEQIREWDAYTITNEPISSIDLMERAANACVDQLLNLFPQKDSFCVFCGKGNNGGDGLAIARILYENGLNVAVFELFSDKAGSADYQANKQRLRQIDIPIQVIKCEDNFPNSLENAIIINALFGSGLNKPLEGLAGILVSYLNTLSNIKISIDVPSGMFLDTSSQGNIVFRADYTFAFQRLKFCLLLAENAPYFGKIFVLNIGLSESFKPKSVSNFEIVNLDFIRKIYRPRNEYGHKGTFGHALLVAGNSGKMGAAILAAIASLRSGVGLLTCNIPKSEHLVLPIAIPEAMTEFRENETDFSKYKSIGVGPGLGLDETKLLKNILDKCSVPMVLDADALNMISQNPEWLSLIPKNSILSPHPKEFERLFGQQENEAARIEKALEISTKYPFVIILKGHHSLIAYRGKGYFNTTGNAGMATGGSGDTLTGILTSLLAQGYTGVDAAILGVYIHGLAGDLALERESEESLLPSDISRYLGVAFKSLR